MKFKYDSNISSEELLNRLQPVLIEKYGTAMTIERNETGSFSVSFNDHIYDIHTKEDDTMSLWWRQSFSKAFFSFGYYTSYKKNLQSMGILVYEIQRCCGITE